MEEIWKDIEGYEGLYQVSNLGRVRSVDRYDGLNHFLKGKIKKQTKDKTGYFTTHLWKDGKNKCCKVHRLVAQAFLDNPNNLLQVNHKDEDKTNNRVNNLEWCDAVHNQNWGTINERRSKSLSTSILQFDLEGNFIKRWDGMKTAASELCILYQNISKCCRGVRKQFKGYKWGYAEEYERIPFKIFELEIYKRKGIV